MAKKTAQVDVKVTGSQSLNDIEQELAAINSELATMDVNSDAFAEMATQAQALDGQLQGVNQQLSYISPAEQADGFLKMGEGILGSVAAVQGLSAAFGGNTEKMEETIKKLVGLVAAMDGMRKVSEALQRENLAKLQRGFQSVGKAATKGFGAVRDSIGGVTKSFGLFQGATTKGVKIMNTALTGFILTAILVALTLAIAAVIKNWDKLVGLFSGNKKAINDNAKAMEKLTESLGAYNDELAITNKQLQDVVEEYDNLSELDANKLFDSKELREYQKNISDLEVQLSGLRKNSIEYLQKEKQLSDERIKQQQFLLRGVTAAQEAGLAAAGDLEEYRKGVKAAGDEVERLKTVNEDAEKAYQAAVQAKRALIEADAGRRDYVELDGIKFTLKDIVKEEERRKALAEETTDNYETSSQIFENLRSVYLSLFEGTEVDEVQKSLNELKVRSEEIEDEILAYRKKKNEEWLAIVQEINEKTAKTLANQKITIAVDIDTDVIKTINLAPTPATTTAWEQFFDNIMVGWWDVEDATEEFGTNMADFSNEYLAPLGAELSNLAMASADLFAAEQEQIIALAEMEIESAQKVADAKAEEEQRLIDLQKENNDDILGLQELLKDANAERYAEIQASIAEEEQANAQLAKQEAVATKEKEKQLDLIAAKEFEIAMAQWEIGKKDLEASRVSAGIQGALAIINALASPFPLNIALPIIIGAATGIQIAAINKQLGTYDATKPEKAEEGMLVGASHAGGGIPIEAEGGEFIVNKRSTSAYLPLIEAINNQGRPKYADGGQVPNLSTAQDAAILDYDLLAAKIKEGIQPVVSVLEITDKQNRVKVIESKAAI